MATQSSILAWRIPGTEEPSGLLSMGSHRVGHNWSDLASAAANYWTCRGGPLESLICSQVTQKYGQAWDPLIVLGVWGMWEWVSGYEGLWIFIRPLFQNFSMNYLVSVLRVWSLWFLEGLFFTFWLVLFVGCVESMSLCTYWGFMFQGLNVRYLGVYV